MTHDFCKVEVQGRLLVVTLDRAQQLNALHKAAHYELARIFDAFEEDRELWAAVLTGTGQKAFCTGADIKSDPLTDDFVPHTGFAGLTHRFDRRKPIIAAVNGLALGGGFEAALACDLIIAASGARFGLTEPRVGLYAAAGGIQRLTQLIGRTRANSMMLTGRQVTAGEGLALGFVNEVVDAADLMAAAHRWADEILSCSPTALRAILAITGTMDATVRESMAVMQSLPEVGDVGTSPDLMEGGRAFAERRKPAWDNPPARASALDRGDRAAQV